jgi:hypothetical protein
VNCLAGSRAEKSRSGRAPGGWDGGGGLVEIDHRIGHFTVRDLYLIRGTFEIRAEDLAMWPLLVVEAVVILTTYLTCNPPEYRPHPGRPMGLGGAGGSTPAEVEDEAGSRGMNPPPASVPRESTWPLCRMGL